MMKHIYLFTILLVFQLTSFSQGVNCSTSDPFCTGTTYTFPNSTSTSSLGSINCCTTTPNPAWYFMELDAGGNMTIEISQVDTWGSGIDVDFVLFGPYPNMTAACTSIPGGAVEDCSYLPAAVEYADITGGVIGEIYVLLLTNYSDDPGTISFSQTGGSASADCALLCGVTGFTATPGACNPVTNQYSVSGVLDISNPPASGTLTFTNSCGGAPVVVSAPFAASIPYSFSGLPSNGLPCTVSTTFSADGTCNSSVSYTAPGSCTPPAPYCALSVSSTPGACNPATNLYTVSGSLSFVNPPATGTLTVSTTCGGSQVFSAPFASPLPYSIAGLTSDGLPCTVNAAFSDSLACTATSTYTAPANCTPACNISSVTANVTGCSPLTNTYNVTGNISFADAPATGTLTVTSSCGGSQIFSAPFSSPQAYAITGLPAGAGAGCTVTAVFSDEAGCTSSTSYTIPVPPTIVPVVPLCTDSPVTAFSAAPTGGTWNGPGTTASGSFNPASAGAGSHTIIYVSAGSCPLSDSITAVINPLPAVNAPGDVSLCSGQSVSLPVTGTASSFSWTPSSSLSSSTSSNPVATPATTTTYTVTGTDANGCSNTDDVTVSIVASPVITITPTAIATICIGDSVQLDADGGDTYSWSPAAGLSATNIENPYASPATTQTYTVTGTNAVGCSATATVTVTVIDPNASFTANPPGGSAPLTVDFDNTSSGTIYIWSFGNGVTDTTNNLSPDAGTVYDSAGTYTIILVAIQGTCVDTAYMTLVVSPVSSILVPNIITANGDGTNDDFRVNATALETLDVQIFNRWGKKVGVISAPDGKWSGREYAEGTYFYILHARGYDGVAYELTGNFTLVK